MSRPALAYLALSALAASCVYGWDDYAPRAGSGDTTSSGGGGGAGTTTTTSSAGGLGGMAGAAGAPGGAGGGGAGGAGGTQQVSYEAAVADCVFTGYQNPDFCDSNHGGDEIGVDGSVIHYGEEHSYLRFEVDGAIAGKQVLAVTLSLRAAADSSSDNSGEVWRVETFMRTDLFNSMPDKLDITPLAADLGAVNSNQQVTFDLPIGVVKASQPLCLGMLPIAGNTDGIDYRNLATNHPPTLTIDYQ